MMYAIRILFASFITHNKLWDLVFDNLYRFLCLGAQFNLETSHLLNVKASYLISVLLF